MERLRQGWETFQGPVHVGGSHAKTYRRETTQMQCMKHDRINFYRRLESDRIKYLPYASYNEIKIE